MTNEPRILRATQIIENPEVEFPTIAHQGRVLAFQRFGPASYRGNLKAMSKKRFRSEKGIEFTLQPATTAQSLAIAVQNPRETKEEILDSNWLQLGPYVKGTSWIAINPPIDRQGNLVRDEAGIKLFVHETQLSDGIYLVPDSDNTRNFAFVPANTYQLGAQEHRTFLQSGLARGLDHAQGKVALLPALANVELYPKGMYVSDAFKPTGKVGQTNQLVARLGSYGDVHGVRLNVGGYWDDDYGGYAFGVFDSGEAAQKI